MLRLQGTDKAKRKLHPWLIKGVNKRPRPRKLSHVQCEAHERHPWLNFSSSYHWTFDEAAESLGLVSYVRQKAQSCSALDPFANAWGKTTHTFVVAYSRKVAILVQVFISLSRQTKVTLSRSKVHSKMPTSRQKNNDKNEKRISNAVRH